MESVIDLARRAPLDSDAHVESFHAKLLELIKKTGEKKLAGSVDKVMADLLLSPAHGQGLACAELIVVKLAAANFEVKDFNLLIEQCRAVLLGISARDARVGSKAVTILARQMTKAMLSTDKCMRGLGALKAIVEKITVSAPGVVTSIHVDLMLVVLKCHAYDLVSDLAFLKPDQALLQIAPQSWPIETSDYLQLWYYLGMYHSALQQFPEAVESFNLALSVPNVGAVSSVQVESYKKLILVSLLASGESPVLNQRMSSAALIRCLDALSVPYAELAKAYRKCVSAGGSSSGASTAMAEMQHLVEAHAEQFLHDKNLGLVKQILKSLVKKNVTKLTQTYLTFSLQDVAAHLNLPAAAAATAAGAAAAIPPAQQAEKYVFDMICTKDVFARLNSKASMVRFLDDPEEYDTAPFIRKMDSKIAEIVVLNAALADKEKTLQLAPAYLLKSMRGAAGGQGGHEMDMAVARSLQDAHGGGGGAGFADDDDQLQAALQASMQQ